MRCGLDLGGPEAHEVAALSREALDALVRREAVLGALRAASPYRSQGAMPTAATGPMTPATSGVPARPAATGVPARPASSGRRPGTPPGAPMPLPGRARPSSLGLQQILAAAGAGLLAVAAVVFVFFTLADSLTLRALVTGVVTVVAGLAAVVLRRARLVSTAESLAALTVVLLLVDIELTLSASTPGAASGLVRAGLYAVVCGGLLGAGRWATMRSWVAGGVLLLPVVPVLLGTGIATAALASPDARFSPTLWIWCRVLGLLAAVLVSLAAGGVARWAGAARAVEPGGPEHTAEPGGVEPTAAEGEPTSAEQAATPTPTKPIVAVAIVGVVRCVAFVGAVLLAVVASPVVPSIPFSGVTLLLAAAAATAACVARVTKQRPWAAVAGAVAVGAGALAGVVLGGWGVAIAPAAGLVVWLALLASSQLTRRSDGARATLSAGGFVVQLMTALPPLGVIVGALVSITEGDYASSDPYQSRGEAGLEAASTGIGATLVTAALLGLVATLVMFLVAGRLRWLVPVTPSHTAPGAGLGGIGLPGQGLDGAGSLGVGHAGHGGAVPGTWSATAASVPGPRGEGPPGITRAARELAPWLALVLLVGFSVHPSLSVVGAVCVATVVAALLLAGVVVPGVAPRVVALVSSRPGLAPIGAREAAAWRRAAVAGAFVLTAVVAVSSWAARPTTLVAGGAVVLLVLASRAVVHRAAGPWLVALAYGYGLVLLGVGLSWTDLETVAVVCTVSGTASVIALVVTAVRRIGRDTWWAVLATTFVPFAAGVATLLEERSWWSAGAATIMLALEAVLVTTNRRGAASWLRATAALGLLPTASVVIVSAGAMVIQGSGAPVVLPVIAALVAATAIGAAPLSAMLVGRGLDVPAAGAVRLAVEISALVTGAFAILLTSVRASAGPETDVALLSLLAAGAGAVGLHSDRRPAWWLSAALWITTLWTSLHLAGVELVEAYTVPPALAAILVGAILARRRYRWWGLVASGLGLLVVPTLIVQVAEVVGAPDVAGAVAADTRAWVALGAGGVFLVAVAYLRRRTTRWSRAFAVRLAAAAVLAATGGVIQSLAVANLPYDDADATQLFLVGLAWAFAAAGLAAVGGAQMLVLVRGLTFPAQVARVASMVSGGVGSSAGVAGATRPGALDPRALDPRAPTRAPTIATLRDLVVRWWAAPALAMAVVGPVAGVRSTWTAIVILLVGEVALLALTVVAVRRALRRPGLLDLPPAWFLWGLALAAAIGAWFPRALRVEVFSLPLGLGLLLAGYLAMQATAGLPGVRGDAVGSPPGPALALGARRSWPVGFVGSWRTLAPGLLALVGPSILATNTDPRTWRATLVVVIALACVLVGTRKHLAAPFTVGVAVLPIEIVVVFVSQLDSKIDAGSWMLTLGAAGGLLLIIATYYERRIAKFGGAAAYLRDLR